MNFIPLVTRSVDRSDKKQMGAQAGERRFALHAPGSPQDQLTVRRVLESVSQIRQPPCEALDADELVDRHPRLLHLSA